MKRAKKSKSSAFGRMGLLFEGLLVVFAFGALGDMGRRLLGLDQTYSAGAYLAYASLLALVVLPAAFFGLRARSENFHTIGLSRERFAPAVALLLGVAAGLGVAALAFGMELAFQMLGLPAPTPSIEVTGRLGFCTFVLGGLLMALCEEVVFRGYALRRLEAALAKGGKSTQGTRWAVFLLAALFGLAAMNLGWTGQLEAGVLSLALFGVFFAAKRDLGVVIAAHATLSGIGFWFAWVSG